MSGAEVAVRREVIVGKNSAIWRVLSKNPAIAAKFRVTLGHRDLAEARLTSGDRVWVLSYSRKSEENSALLAKLKDAGVRDVVYFSSATTNVVSITDCYNYPRIKLLAENQAREMLDARILTLGVLFEKSSDLPAGVTIATGFDQLAEFLLEPRWPAHREERTLLFRLEDRPFSGIFEQFAFKTYGSAMRICRRWPCALRPLDFVLRALGYRWYGYVYLSNRLWLSTTS